MKKHTFKKGDRVIVGGFGNGVFERRHDEEIPGNVLVLLDNRHPGCYSPYYSSRESYVTHDIDIQPGDWVRHESVNGHDEEMDRKIYQRSLNDDSNLGIYQMQTKELCHRCNLVKIQPPTKESDMDETKTAPTPQEQWIATYYPVPASEMKGKSDVECLDHAILKYRGCRSDVLEELGLSVAPIRSGCEDCALCENHLKRSALLDDRCQTCPLVIHGKGTCLRGGSVWGRAVSNPQIMIDELVQVKKKVIAAETEAQAKAKMPQKLQFYVNGHGPYVSIQVELAGQDGHLWKIARINGRGIRRIESVSSNLGIKMHGSKIALADE